MPSSRILDVMLDRPLLVFKESKKERPEEEPLEEALADDEWDSAERWLDCVEKVSDNLAGIVLPLELQGLSHCRSGLWGIELLRWLRWSAKGVLRLTPVLVTSWQALDKVLRRKPEMLLASSGTYFVRLPEVMDGPLESFKAEVRENPEKVRADLERLDALASGGLSEALQTTHHDLANEGYAAWRLWDGYRKALTDANGKGQQAVKERLKWANAIDFGEILKIKDKLRQPAFRQFQIARRSVPVPNNPAVDDAEKLVREHAAHGLPGALRILLVDDEFEKGIALSLLKILFGDVEFTSLGPNSEEWVYSEARDRGQANSEMPGTPSPASQPIPALGKLVQATSTTSRWVRFACVKNTTAAMHWLEHWGELDATGDVKLSITYENWRDRWAVALGRDPSTREDDDVLRMGDATHTALDSKSRASAKPITVILLDLRLNRDQPKSARDPNELDSVVFRRAVKHERSDLPVIILTASRQALNYAVAMAGAESQDGWVTKEAPDVPIDDANSSRAVHYLFERLHLFSMAGEWYSPELGWPTTPIRDFNELWEHQQREILLGEVRDKATEILEATKTSGSRPAAYGVRFRRFIQSQLPSPTCKVMQLLLERKVFLACLLDTADWSGGKPSWNVETFKMRLPQGPGPWEMDVEGIYHVVPYTRDLYFPARRAPFKSLLTEEGAWLLAQLWGDHHAECIAYLNQCFQRASTAEQSS